mmetsp:Transcript_42798/g.96082  ORF Transcript_42798/g.96082 Transcript_42798/m.96082 type:complete len:248 (-) Transcript_42798:36-779(-)
MTKTVAVLWASRGGLGDVGKFAAMHAAKRESVELRAIAISEDGSETGIETTDVVPTSRREPLQQALEGIEILKLNIADKSCHERLVEVFRGCDAVIACPGSRQSGIARTCALGARKVVDAMTEAQVSRVVVLSSMGIGKDFLPTSGLTMLWGCLLSCAWPSTKKDLQEMEATVESSGHNFLLVRPMGVDPAELPRNSYSLLTEPGRKSLPFTVAKDDVGLFLLEEALEPSHSGGVTIGRSAEPAATV